MRNFNTCNAPRTKPFCLMRLVALFLCAFHLAALARVVHPTQLKLDAKASNNTIPYDDLLGSRRKGPLASPTPTQLAPIVSSNDNNFQRLSIIKRAEGDKTTWDYALKTGKRILNDHQERLSSGGPGYTGHPGGSEEARGVLRDEYIAVDENQNYEPDDFLKRSLTHDGITTKKGKWYFSFIQENYCKSSFMNAYVYDEDKQEGVIIAQLNSRERDAALKWSEAAFQEYNVKVPNSVPEKLKYIYRSSIINESTKEFISKAIESGDGRQVDLEDEEWHVFQPGSETFTALLGSENGRGAGYMINDHLAEMGRKQVSEIHVSSRPHWLMKIVIGPVS